MNELSTITPAAADPAPRAPVAAPVLRGVWGLAPWSLFMMAFVWTGGIVFEVVPRTLKVRDQSANNSTNAKLNLDVGFEGDISAIVERIHALPRGANVAVVCEEDVYLTSAQIISLAVWSDGRRPIQIERMDAGVLTEMEKAGVDAAFILDKKKSWFPKGTETLAECLFFVRQISSKP